MGEQFILKGGNNKKNNDKKKSGGSDKKKSGGSDKKSGGSDKKSGGVNETLINMDMGGGGAILDNFMSQENATNGDGFLSGSSYSVTGGTMYKGGAGAETTLRNILKKLIDEKRDDIINMLKLKFLSFTNKLNQTGDVNTYINQLKELFINNEMVEEEIQETKSKLQRIGLGSSNKIMVMKEDSDNPFNNIIKELKNIIIDDIDINNLSKSNIGLFNFIDFDFVITKSTKLDGGDIQRSKPLYILRIIIKYINKDKKNISVKEIHTYGNNTYVIVTNTQIQMADNTSAFIQTNDNKIPQLNEIYYSSTSYIHNIHNLILYKKKCIENDTISNNCAKIIYELLGKLSKKYNNKEVIDIEDIRKEQEPVLDHVKTFKETLENTSIPTKDLLEVLTYLDKNINSPQPIAPVAAPEQVSAQGEAAATAEAAPEKKNIIKLLIDKVRECYDLCETDNIYLNMSTKEFLENIEKYLIEIFNMENEEKYKSMLKDLIQEEEKRVEEEDSKKRINALKVETAEEAVAVVDSAEEAVKRANVAIQTLENLRNHGLREVTEEINKADIAAKKVEEEAERAKNAAIKAAIKDANLMQKVDALNEAKKAAKAAAAAATLATAAAAAAAAKAAEEQEVAEVKAARTEADKAQTAAVKAKAAQAEAETARIEAETARAEAQAAAVKAKAAQAAAVKAKAAQAEAAAGSPPEAAQAQAEAQAEADKAVQAAARAAAEADKAKAALAEAAAAAQEAARAAAEAATQAAAAAGSTAAAAAQEAATQAARAQAEATEAARAARTEADRAQAAQVEADKAKAEAAEAAGSPPEAEAQAD
jgi:hypothetical protein